MRYIIGIIAALFLMIAPIPAQSQDVDPVPVCTSMLSGLESEMKKAEIEYIVLSDDRLDAFSRAIVPLVGEKDPKIKYVLIPDITDDSYKGDPDQIMIALFDANRCYLGAVTFPRKVIEVGFGINV